MDPSHSPRLQVLQDATPPGPQICDASSFLQAGSMPNPTVLQQSKACLKEYTEISGIMFRNAGIRSRAFLVWECFVQGTLTISFEIERYIREAGALQGLRDRRARLSRKRAIHFFRCDFDARQLVVQAHTKLPEAKFAQGGFATLDERQPLGSNLGAVRHARGKACRGGARPSRQYPALGGEPDFRFSH